MLASKNVESLWCILEHFAKFTGNTKLMFTKTRPLLF